MTHEGHTPPPERVARMAAVQTGWERRNAYAACLRAERLLELAGLDYDARTVRAIRVTLFRDA